MLLMNTWRNGWLQVKKQRKKDIVKTVTRNACDCDYCRWSAVDGGRSCLKRVAHDSAWLCTREAGHEGACVACGGDRSKHVSIIKKL